MNQFLHGIRRSVLEAWGLPCLPFLLLFGGSANEANEIQQEDDSLADADIDLHDEENKGDLLPLSGDDYGDLLPQLNGEGTAENRALLAPCHGHQDDEPANKEHMLPTIDGLNTEEDGILPPKQRGEEWGRFQPLHAKSGDGGTFKPANANEDDDGVLRPTIGDILKGDFNSYFYYIPLDVMHDVFTYLHAEIGGHEHEGSEERGKLQPMPRPRVKMKAEVKLFFLITGMLDPGILVDHMDTHSWDHDGWVPTSLSPHHEFHHSSLHISSSPSTITLQATADAGRNSLIPLRGRRCDQWNDEVEHEDVAASKMKTPHAGLKMHTTQRMERLFYLTKDVLDPG